MLAIRWIAIVLAALSLTACGTYVPDIQEIGDDTQGFFLVKAIIGSIHCELRNAVAEVFKE